MRSEKGESVLGSIAIVLVIILVVVAGSVVAWKLGWFVESKNTDRQVQIDNRNTGTQTAWHDQVVQDIKDFNLLDETDTARRGAIRDEACRLIPRLTEPYRDNPIIRFELEECS